MKKESIFVFILIIGIILYFISFGSSQEFLSDKKSLIEKKKIENGDKKRYTLIDYNLSDSKKIFKHNNSSTVYLNKKEYEELKKNKTITIIPQKVYKPLLQNAISVVNVSAAWNLKINGINLTGVNQAVCIIDTGANYSHQDIGNGFGTGYKILAGYDTEYNTPDFSDWEGHGTHVAGIVGANGNINGIAKQVNLVIIAAYYYGDEVNDAGFYDDSLREAIDHCIANKTRYNISVISMSLGGGQNSSFCDSDISNLALSQKIQEAIDQNISVVVATGNTGAGYTNNSAGISAPACFQNVTRVGSTNKDDSYASYGFRNQNFTDILFAPGTLINSTDYNGFSYVNKSGTSMATPQVSAAIAIINQYLSSKGLQYTPQQIKDLLRNNGRLIYDLSTARNYSRIDIYSTLLNLETDAPVTTLISPQDNLNNVTDNWVFSFNVTDWQIKNSTFYLWYSNGTLLNQQTTNLTGTQNSSLFNVGNILQGDYIWNIISYDNKNNGAFSSSNNSFSVSLIIPELNSPQNNTYTNINLSTFNCSAITDSRYAFTNVTLYIWNSTMLVNSTTKLISGLQNSSVTEYNLTQEENYTWNCLFYNNNSTNSFADNNFSLIFDISEPEIADVLSNTTTSTATITWNTNENANSSISIGGQTQNSSIYTMTHSLTFTSLSSSTNYNYNVSSCDSAGNCNSTNSSFTTTSEAISNSGGGSSGGGGGGGGPTSIKLTTQQISEGVTKNIAAGDKLYLRLSGEYLENHTLKLNKLLNNSANITISSDPINFILNIGEYKKLNISSSEYFDLYIKLENITGGKANLTIKEIKELILDKKSLINLNETKNQRQNIYYPAESNLEENKGNGKYFLETIIIFITLFIIIKICRAIIKRKGFYTTKITNLNGTKKSKTNSKRKR